MQYFFTKGLLQKSLLFMLALVMLGTHEIKAQENDTLSPKIVIKGNNQIIANQDSTPSHSDNTDFGSWETFGEQNINTFIIENQGNDTLRLTGTPIVQLKKVDTTAFSIEKQPEIRQLLPGNTEPFEIQFDPDSLVKKTAWVHIESNDTSNNPYEFLIQGEGHGTGMKESDARSPYRIYYQENQIRIKFNEPGFKNGEISLLSLRGKVARSPKSISGKENHVISTQNLAKGYYVLRMVSEGRVYSRKVLVR